MTLALFPTNLPGISWDWTRAPTNSTRVQTARSGLEYRVADWSYGIYKYSGVYEFLRSTAAYNELQTLFGFCQQQQGMFNTFAFQDPEDNSVTTQNIAAGDGSTTIFPLVRTYGGWTEPVLLANSISNVYLNGTNQVSGWNGYQAGRYGTDSIQFSSPPGNGVLITATFSYYFPARFLQDDPEFGNFMYKFWELKKLDFQTVK